MIFIIQNNSSNVIVLISVAFLTLLTRKILGYIEDRKRSNKIILFGMFQPFSNALKLFSKKWFFFNYSNLFIYRLIIIFFFIISYMNFISLN